jgi:hypothetical protein
MNVGRHSGRFSYGQGPFSTGHFRKRRRGVPFRRIAQDGRSPFRLDELVLGELR